MFVRIGGCFGYFLIFSCSGRGKGESEAPGGGGGWFFLENPRRGLSRRRRGRGAGRVPAVNCGGGVGAKYFFSGPNCGQTHLSGEKCPEKSSRKIPGKSSKSYHWGQKDYLPTFYSRRIIFGNSMCFLRVSSRGYRKHVRAFRRSLAKVKPCFGEPPCSFSANVCLFTEYPVCTAPIACQ